MGSYKGDTSTTAALDAFVKLFRAQITFTKAFEKVSPMPKGLTQTQFGVLETLYHIGPQHQCDLARKILKSSANLTLVIDNLVKNGLVERQKDPDDRRNNIVILTPKGDEIIRKIFPAKAEAITGLFTVLDAKELRQFSALCKKLGRGIEAQFLESNL